MADFYHTNLGQVGAGSEPAPTCPYRTYPYRTCPHRTCPYRTCPYRTAPTEPAPTEPLGLLHVWRRGWAEGQYLAYQGLYGFQLLIKVRPYPLPKRSHPLTERLFI